MSPQAPSAGFAVIIPARYASSRYPGKPLAMLKGAGGVAKPLIQRSWEAACAVPGASGVWVATDDPRIADAVVGFGGQVVMTASTCRNGTERCAEAARVLAAEGHVFDILVNLQGDAPLTPSFVVSDLVAALRAEPALDAKRMGGGAGMATVALACSASTYAHLAADAAAGRVGGTTVVANAVGQALYFSKRLIPHVAPGTPDAHQFLRLHLGLYAYRVAALAAYAATPPSPLEELEGLEQLRFFEGIAPVRVMTFAAPAWDCIELNNPQDVPVIEVVLAQRGIA